MKWSCKFWNFVSYNERTIVNHYKDKHGRGRRGFSCIYENCLTVLKSHVEFAQHVKKHRKETNAIAKVRCDHLVPRLLEVYKAAVLSGKKQALKGILDCLEKDNTNERKRTAALLGLPHYLSEDPADVIRICDAHGETLDVAMKGMQVGLLIGHEGALQDAFPRDIFGVAVVVEETIVLHNLKDVACSFAMLMGIIYCVNLEYPQAMKYSFEFLQRVVMKVKPDQASARIHGLRNKLLRYKL
ncbi:hypothetical protein SRHO_G00179240 [Serrasalmus rhombeus]